MKKKNEREKKGKNPCSGVVKQTRKFEASQLSVGSFGI